MDAYAPYCLHGTLPLVRDEREACGYRFAQIGQDPLEACISDPAHLPAGELTLRTFGSAAEAEAYAAALAEHGGNAFTSLLSPLHLGVEPFLLVIRHDRDREPAATLDEAVQPIGPARPSAAAWSQARSSIAFTVADTRRRQALTTRWQAAQDLIRSIGEAHVTRLDEAGVEFMSAGARVRFVLGEHAGAPVVSWSRIAYALDPDLARLAADEVAAAGVEKIDRGTYLVRLRALSADELARAIAAECAIAIAEERLADVSNNRRVLAEIAADPAATRVLARAAAGLLILSIEPGAPAAQLSPKSGTPQTVSGALVGRLVRHGLLVPAWVPAMVTREDPRTWCPRLYVPTVAGRLVAAGRTIEAADLVGNLRLPRAEPAPVHGGGLFQVLASLGGGMQEDVRERLSQAVGPHLPIDGATLADAAGYGRSYSSWSPIVHGALAGLLVLDEDGRVRKTAPAAAPASPRP